MALLLTDPSILHRSSQNVACVRNPIWMTCNNNLRRGELFHIVITNPAKLWDELGSQQGHRSKSAVAYLWGQISHIQNMATFPVIFWTSFVWTWGNLKRIRNAMVSSQAFIFKLQYICPWTLHRDPCALKDHMISCFNQLQRCQKPVFFCFCWALCSTMWGLS